MYILLFKVNQLAYIEYNILKKVIVVKKLQIILIFIFKLTIV